MKLSKKEEASLIAQVKELVKPGDTIFTILRHVSRSGMQRRISTLIWDKDLNDMREISFLFGPLSGYRLPKNGEAGIIADGCGMDMGFSIVYNVSVAVFGLQNGYALKHNWL